MTEAQKNDQTVNRVTQWQLPVPGRSDPLNLLQIDAFTLDPANPTMVPIIPSSTKYYVHLTVPIGPRGQEQPFDTDLEIKATSIADAVNKIKSGYIQQNLSAHMEREMAELNKEIAKARAEAPRVVVPK